MTAASVASTFGGCLVAAAVAATTIPAAVQQSIDQRVQRGLNAGIVVGVRDREGDRYYRAGRRVAGGEPVDEQTLFEIGSMTKAFTATLLADMVARGEVGLADPVARFLPSQATVPERSRAISLADLATHTSGLPRLPTNLLPLNPLDPYAGYTEQMLYAFLRDHRLRRDVGVEYEYSNVGYGLLGHALARRAGLPYELALARVTQPLRLTDTGIELSPDQASRLAHGHNAAGPVPGWHLPALAGAGALKSTPRDMLRFLAAQAGLIGDVDASRLTTAHQPRHRISKDMSIGLGWHIRHAAGRDIVWHNGGTGGYRSFGGFVAGERAVIVLTNSSQGVDDIGFHLLEPSLPLRSLALLRIGHAGSLARDSVTRWVARRGHAS